MVTVHHKMVGLERMLEYRVVRLQRFHFVDGQVIVEPQNTAYYDIVEFMSFLHCVL